jgi:hypothetical protein
MSQPNDSITHLRPLSTNNSPDHDDRTNPSSMWLKAAAKQGGRHEGPLEAVAAGLERRRSETLNIASHERRRLEASGWAPWLGSRRIAAPPDERLQRPSSPLQNLRWPSMAPRFQPPRPTEQLMCF